MLAEEYSTNGFTSGRNDDVEARLSDHDRVNLSAQRGDVWRAKVRLEIIKAAPAFVHDERVSIVCLSMELIGQHTSLSRCLRGGLAEGCREPRACTGTYAKARDNRQGLTPIAELTLKRIDNSADFICSRGVHDVCQAFLSN